MHFAGRWLIWFDPIHRFPGLAEDIGIGDCASSYVDGVAARFVESPHRVFGFEYVAAAGNRDRDMAFDLSHQVPVSQSPVALKSCATVQRDHRSAAIFDQ